MSQTEGRLVDVTFVCRMQNLLQCMIQNLSRYARWDIHSLPTIGSRTLPNTTPPDRDNLGADIGAQMRHDLFLYGVLYLINTKAAADAVEACAKVYRSTHPGMHFFVAFLHSTRGKMSHVHSTPTLCIVGTLPLHSSASSGQVDGWTWSTII